MRRSVILMGGKTYVISLPSQWIKKFNVKKGEELDVIENDNSILIKTNNLFSAGSREINVGSAERMLGRTIGALYKAGYDDVKVVFENPGQLAKIEDTLRKTCIGFEITNQGKNFVQITSLTRSVPEEFDNSLKRLFYTVEVMNQELIEALKNSDKEKLNQVAAKDDQVNKLADFCRRVINQGEIKSINRPNLIYYIVEQLERIGDIYKKIARSDIKSTDYALKNFESINSMFIDYRKLYYNFNLNDLESFGKKFDLLKENVSKNDNPFRMHQELLIEYIFDMNGGLITLKL